MATQYAESTMIRGITGGMAGASNNALHVTPRSRFQEAVRSGNAFNWSSLTYNMAAADTIFGLENNDSLRDLYIHRMWLSSDTASTIQIFTCKDITVAGATAIVGYNLNRNFNTVAATTAYTKETGQNEAATSWTGKLYMISVPVDTLIELKIDGSIVLPNEHMVGVDMAADAGAVNVSVWGWFE